MKTTNSSTSPHHVRHPLQSGMHFESLEPRRLLAALTISDVIVVNGIDHDNDMFMRSFDLQYIVEATGTGPSYYRTDFYAQPVGSLSRQLILQSAVESIEPGQSRTSSYPINPELTGVPVGGSGRVHYSLTLVPLDAPPATFEDVDISDISMEFAALDQEAPDVPPVVSSFEASPNGSSTPLIEDMTVNISVRAQSEVGIRSVTLFFDRDGNGLLEPADRFGPEAFSTVKNATFGAGSLADGIWIAEFLVDPDWTSGTISWGAIAVDFAGNVSIPVFTTTRVSQPPRVEGVTPFVLRGTQGWIELTDAAMWFQSGTTFVYGESLSIRPQITTFAPLADVFYIFDRDNSGRWSNGDGILGRGDPNFDYQLNFVLDSNWGIRTPAHIIVDAVDINGLWTRQLGSVAFTVTDKPVVNSVVVPPSAGAGQTINVSATVSDSDPASVFWYIDRLPNFRYDAGTDVAIGTDSNGNDGWQLNALVLESWAGRSVIMAEATDAQGARSASVSGGAAWISAGPIVAFISTTPALSDGFAAGQSVTITAHVSTGIPLTGVTYFLDYNGDVAFTPGVDIPLGEDRDPNGGWTLQLTIPTGWQHLSARFAANAFNSVRFGDFSTATNRVSFSNGPLVRSVVTSSQQLTWGESFTISAPVVDGGNIRAVTFFYDADMNGRWSPGIDTDLGADFNGTNGWSITATVSSSWMVTHFGYFVANAVNTSGAWGTTTRLSSVVSIFDRPRLSDPTVSSPGLIGPNTITFGSIGDVGASATANAFGVVAFTFFVDIDQNGSWTSGTDVDLGAVFLVEPRTFATRTKPVIFNWGIGTFTVLADARDANGRWSGSPISQSITLV